MKTKNNTMKAPKTTKEWVMLIYMTFIVILFFLGLILK